MAYLRFCVNRPGKARKMMKKAMFVDLLNLFWDQHGIYSMASYMKRHVIDVKYVGTRNFNIALAAIRRIWPDFILYSSFSSNLSKCIEFDRILKQQRRVTSVIGGGSDDIWLGRPRRIYYRYVLRR